MGNRRSIVFFLPSLVTGGAERVALTLASAFAAKDCKVTILLRKNEGELLKLVPKNVRLVSLGTPRTISALFPLAGFLSKERPDILISSLGQNNVVALLAKLVSNVDTKVIISQYAPLSAEIKFHNNFKYKMLPYLYRFLARQAHVIVAVSNSVADDLARTAKIKRNKILTIYNPVISPDFDRRASEKIDHPWFQQDAWPVVLGVGRLSEEKDFSTLIAAFADVAQKRDVRLVILGDGPLKDRLTSETKRLDVKIQIAFLGYQPNPLPYMRAAAALASSSRYEGFGNVLVEALACGTPVVSTKCQGGANEILANGSYGPMVPVGDAHALAKAIIATMDNPLPRSVLQKRGREFTVERAVNVYEALFR